jgi:hypothetical protein
MGILPTVAIMSDDQLLIYFARHPIVDAGEAALRAAGARTHTDAVVLLSTWQFRPALSVRERAAVLARFRVCGMCGGEIRWINCRDPYWRHVDRPPVHVGVTPVITYTGSWGAR